MRDGEGSSDLASVATPPAAPSGMHLSTAWEDFVLDACLARLGVIKKKIIKCEMDPWVVCVYDGP